MSRLRCSLSALLLAAALPSTTRADPAATTPGMLQLLRTGVASRAILDRPTFVPNPKVVKIPTTTATVKSGILDCVQTRIAGRTVSETCMTRFMPLIEQTDPRVPPELKPSADVGCFDAAILTVLRTQLAHAHPSLKVEGRTAMLVRAVGNAATPAEVAALSMLYRMQLAGQRQRDLVAKGVVSTPWASYYRLQEAAADLNGGRVLEQTADPGCNPYADVYCLSAFNLNASVQMDWAGNETPNKPFDDDMIMRRMREGQSLVLGYIRFRPRVVGVGADRKIVFDMTGPHKVVPSGFSTSGRFRLIINDVGGTGVLTPACGNSEGCLRVQGRLRRDLKTKLTEQGFPDVPVIWPAGVGQVVLEQDGDADSTFRFVEFVNSLSVRKAS